MLLENGTSDAIQFYQLDALSSLFGMNVAFDLQEPAPGGEGHQTTGPCIDLRGAVIFGHGEYARRVAGAQAQNARRSGLLVPA